MVKNVDKKKINKKFDKKINKKALVLTPQEACDLWIKESYSYDYKYFANPSPHKCQRHIPRSLRNIKLSPTEAALLNELRN
jgi:hypothetical protein